MARGARMFSLSATLNAVPLHRSLGYGVAEPGALDLGGLRFPVVRMARTAEIHLAVDDTALVDAED